MLLLLLLLLLYHVPTKSSVSRCFRCLIQPVFWRLPLKFFDLFCGALPTKYITHPLTEGDTLEGQPVGRGSLHRPQ